MRDDIATFPPPREQGQLLGHDGGLAPDEVQHLESLGYSVAHYKSFSGMELVQAYFESLAKGLIEMDPKTFKAIDQMRKQLAKVEAGGSTFKDKTVNNKADVVALLRSRGAEDVVETPTRRRGRPPKASQ